MQLVQLNEKDYEILRRPISWVWCNKECLRGRCISSGQTFAIVRTVIQNSVQHTIDNNNRHGEELARAAQLPEHPNVIKCLGTFRKMAPNNRIRHAVYPEGIPTLAWITSLPRAKTVVVGGINGAKHFSANNFVNEDIKADNTVMADGQLKMIDVGMGYFVQDTSKLHLNIRTGEYLDISYGYGVLVKEVRDRLAEIGLEDESLDSLVTLLDRENVPSLEEIQSHAYFK